MIITTNHKLEVGKIYSNKDFNKDGILDGFHANKEIYFEYTFYVIRESNNEEYQKCCIEMYGNCDPMIMDNFYEVSMD